jgi:hypothetical protein
VSQLTAHPYRQQSSRATGTEQVNSAGITDNN